MWVTRARAGDQEAFAALVERYSRPVYSLCLRMLGSATDAEDAAQESFVRAFQALHRYDQSRPFATWLLSIASHHCIDRLRRRRLAEVSLDSLPPWRWLPGVTIDPEEAAGRAIESDRIGRLLLGLPDDYRLVVVLRYWHDLGYAEIAEILGESEAAVKSRLHRARRLLAAGLDSRPHTGSLAPEQSTRGDMEWTVAKVVA
jgi:RNA polymerase sigma-70 factor (ECF subfamily)